MGFTYAMARPKKWFVVFLNGSVRAIVHGQAAALKLKRDSYYAFLTFTDRHAAEEFAAWHEYMVWSRLVTPASRAQLVGGFSTQT